MHIQKYFYFGCYIILRTVHILNILIEVLIDSVIARFLTKINRFALCLS